MKLTRRCFTLSALSTFLLSAACKSEPRSLLVGLQIELTRERITTFRQRARAVNVNHFDTEEVLIKHEGQEKRMTFDEFLARVGMTKG